MKNKKEKKQLIEEELDYVNELYNYTIKSLETYKKQILDYQKEFNNSKLDQKYLTLEYTIEFLSDITSYLSPIKFVHPIRRLSKFEKE
jgi:hypothetical protein